MKYLLITGSYRSGTTYLYKALNNNSKIDILYQPAIRLFKYLDLELRKKLKKKIFYNFPLGITNISKKIELNKILLKKNEINKIVLSLAKKKDSNLKYYIRLRNNLKMKNKFISAREFIEILFDSLVSKANKSNAVVGFKDPFIGSLLKILVQYKKLYIINIIRDPREIFYSRNYSLVKNHNDFKNKKHPVVLTSLICNRNMETDKYLKRQKRYLSINFDDLIKKSKNTKKKISKFLNININLNKNKVQKLSKWKINSSGFGENFGSNWKNSILNDELAIIEKICGVNFKRYKFKKELMNTKKLNLSVKNFKEKDRNILNWTKKPFFLKYSKEKIQKLL